MSRSNPRIVLPLIAVSVFTLALAAAAVAAPHTAIPTVSVVGKGSRIVIGGPSTWGSGAIRITAVSRGGEQEFSLLHFHGGYNYSGFVADGARAHGHTPAAAAAMRRVLANTDFLGGANVFPGTPASFTVTLTPGVYYLGAMNTHPVFRRIVVSGTSPTASPTAAAIVTAFDFGFRSNREALPATGTITIRNSGAQIHRLLLVPVRPGTSRARIGAYLRKTGGQPDGPPPPFAVNGPQLGTAMISPGKQIQLSYKLPPGEYALLCFQPDSRTEKPQTLEGMYGTAILR
jgi:hypothetical protein